MITLDNHIAINILNRHTWRISYTRELEATDADAFGLAVKYDKSDLSISFSKHHLFLGKIDVSRLVSFFGLFKFKIPDLNHPVFVEYERVIDSIKNAGINKTKEKVSAILKQYE